MRILSRYLVARFLGFFAAILFTSTLAIAIVEMLLNFDDMVSSDPPSGPGTGGVLGYLFLRIPSYYLPDLVPLATFAAAFVSIGLSSRWLELTAAKSGGVSPHRIMGPILIAAAMIALASFTLNETVVIRATSEWKLQADGASRPVTYQSGSFWYQRGRTIYNVGEGDRASRTLRAVGLFELGPEGRLTRSIHAERVQISADDDRRWRFENATIRHFDSANPDAPPRVERLAETVLEMTDGSDVALMDADATTLSLGTLREYIGERMQEGDNVQRLETLFHSRLSHPASVLLLAALAIPLGMRVERTRSLGAPALVGVATAAVFFLSRAVAGALSTEGVLPAALACWSVLIFFAALGGWQWVRIPR